MTAKMFRTLFLCALLTTVLTISAFASNVYSGHDAEIDGSTSSKGYISVSCRAEGKKIKVIVSKGGTQYIYNLKNNGASEMFPLQMGNGTYQVKVMENVTGTKYAALLTGNVEAKLASQFAPFLVANQYVDYSSGDKTIATAKQLSKNAKTELDKVRTIYNYVVGAMVYDTQKAQTVQSGYLPDIDKVIAAKKGICFDYAAVLASMLRSQGIPTKLVTGYVSPNNAYHAWNEIYIKDVGWLKTNTFYFDGKTWKLVDSTFASAGKNSSKINKFIGDASHYQKKYEY